MSHMLINRRDLRIIWRFGMLEFGARQVKKVHQGYSLKDLQEILEKPSKGSNKIPTKFQHNFTSSKLDSKICK